MSEPSPEVKLALFALVVRDRRATRRRTIARRAAGAAGAAGGDDFALFGIDAGERTVPVVRSDRPTAEFGIGA